MNDFVSPTKIPKWRIVFWGVLGIAVSAWIAHELKAPGILWGTLIGVPVLMILMLGIIRLGRSSWARRHIGLIIWTYVILQSILLLWRVLGKS